VESSDGKVEEVGEEIREVGGDRRVRRKKSRKIPILFVGRTCDVTLVILYIEDL
jgi:hypothetical protein